MIVFINGAFGVGKSSVAELLVNKVENSLLFDAEEVGYMLRKIYTPIDNPSDFQDLQAFRTLVVQTAEALQNQYKRTLIIPLCLWNENYFDEIVSGLKNIDNDFHHFCLIAGKETIIERLRQRKDPLEVFEWATARLDKMLNNQKSSKFEKKILTENKTVEEIVKEIIGNLI